MLLELAFDPILDVEFSVTTSKQQVQLSQRIWAALKNNAIGAAIYELRDSVQQSLPDRDERKKSSRDGGSPADKAAEAAEKILPKQPETIQAMIALEGEEAIHEKAQEMASSSGEPLADTEKALRDTFRILAMR